MQRLFSTFPDGWPGLGLLLLRISVALPALLNTYGAWEPSPGWALIALVLLSAALSVGFLTPMVALLSLLLRLVGPASLSAGTEGTLYITILGALALAMLGPGAYSIDAYRYGRRLVVLPPAHTGSSARNKQT
jgi:uncharacterized membrane protein YphA (DoxX/SURF4 family)